MIKSQLRRIPLLALALSLLLTACTTTANTAAGPKRDRNAPPAGAGKGRWVKVESATGSNLQRRVWVNDDGSVIPDPGDSVNMQAVGAEAARRVNAGGQRSLKGGN